MGMDNVALTPHIGGATYDVEANQASMIADDVERILGGGRPLHPPTRRSSVTEATGRRPVVAGTDPAQVREAVVHAARELLAKGLTVGTAGNLSARMPDGTHLPHARRRCRTRR